MLAKIQSFFTILLLILIAQAGCVLAENEPVITLASMTDSELTADLIKVSTPNYSHQSSDFTPKTGVFTYQAAWQGIPAAEAKVEVENDGLHYLANISAKTYSAIDVFYKMRYEARGVIGVGDFMPIKSTFDHKENSRTRLTEISFLDSGQVRSYRRKDSKEPQILQFDPQNFMNDPFSVSFLARSTKWESGMKRYYDVFNGKSRYLITLEAVEKSQIPVNGVMKNVWVISPAVDNLTARKANSKLRSAKIYVTDDSDRDVLKISSSVFIGEVSIKLISYEAPSVPGETTLARNRLEYSVN